MGKAFMTFFELSDFKRLLGMPLTKAKNWTIGRPITICPSIRAAYGKGSRNFFSLEDVYLMGLAYELSKAGMAAMAIVKVLDAVKKKLAGKLGKVDMISVWRASGKLTFEVRKGATQPPEGVVVWQTVNAGAMIKRIEARLIQPKRRPKKQSKKQKSGK